ncbi:GNAT family N-acetyltransferase [Microbacterium sp. B2969]|uniref:GNAT family N-acetyltransferase n=1 Tax=Microbacterium alkaliflavum TaxID=3248839 RepID=A0ABW7Q604_9MICO
MDDLAARHHDAPVDEESRAALAAQDLELRIVANDDADGVVEWLRAMERGFLASEPKEEHTRAVAERIVQRRLAGVFDASGPLPGLPIGTFASWVGELTVPGGGGIPSCAISMVTVAPTHRRRGLLRSMMAGELRVAHELGVPMAMLTVSESTIYGRFGFASAAYSARGRIDTTRVRWTGPATPGRIDFITRERFREVAPDLHDRARRAMPGEIAMPVGHWDRFAGTRPDAEHPERIRALQYTDAAGELQGVALYTVRENEADFPRSKAHLLRLVAATADAYAALWRFVLELDLIGEVEASELAVEEPVFWMIGDRRAATVTVRDHQYLRILDVPAALTARRYAASGSVVLDVTDPFGFAEGRWLLEVDADGTATVSTDIPEGLPVVRLGVAELSAAYLGSVSLATLTAAGRVEATDVFAAARLFAWPVPARLSFWY